MKTIAPAYYSAFCCIADRCRHSCCVGWEIDIDTSTAAVYKAITGAFGKRLQHAITEDADTSSFVLTADDRCPFLNERGLCDIILTLGEDALCQICADHPRFRNVLSDRVEIGLGLCCEEAARLILTSDAFALTVLKDDGQDEPLFEDEATLLTERDALFAIACDRQKTICEREQAILLHVGSAPLGAQTLYACYQPLERLEEDWSELLAALLNAVDAEPPEHLQAAFEQLLCYFLYLISPTRSRTTASHSVRPLPSTVSRCYACCVPHTTTRLKAWRSLRGAIPQRSNTPTKTSHSCCRRFEERAKTHNIGCFNDIVRFLL